MDLKIKDKVAVVAASSKGLGRAVAEALAGEGVKLALCSRDKNSIRKTAEELKDRYRVEVLSSVCDVTDKGAVERFKGEVLDFFGTCHILFANAGGPPPGKVEDFPVETFREALDLNLFSTINLVNAFLPAMKTQEWGRILASTSITVKQPLPTLALSNVSRVGVVAFIKSLSVEVGHLDITANTLAPGYIQTERVKNLLNDRAQKENISYDRVSKNISDSIPVKRIGSPEEFGALAAFLASQPAAYITGTTILIDGGMYQGLM